MSEILVMDAAGTVVNLTRAAGFDDHPTWSPDGSHIAFTRFGQTPEDPPPDIWIMNADGAGGVNLTNTATSSEVAPAWSPDGSRILFTREVGLDPAHLAVINVDGTGRTRYAGFAAVGTWSPDGSRIAYLAYERAGFRLYTMNVDGSERTGLTPVGTVGDGLASWSPAGDRLVFESAMEGDNDVYVIGADGTGMMNISNHVAYEGLGPQAWAP
jgi:TolB protein